MQIMGVRPTVITLDYSREFCVNDPRQNIDTSSWPRQSPCEICEACKSTSVIEKSFMRDAD